MGFRHNLCLVLSVLFLCLSLIHNSRSLGSDTISGNQSLSGDQTIVSSGGNFKLGFFKPGNSSKFYIGIWYNKLSILTIVWVANRETPITNNQTSQLKILNGNLVLLNESQIPIWSTNVISTKSNSLEAVLQDDGNLILRDGSNPKQQPIWQSFDFPTHTWLPGARLGLNKLTNKTQLLTNWKNSEDPSPGLFSLMLDPNGTSQYLILWNGSERYWTSGTWNEQIFSLVPEMRSNYIYNFSYISNKNESYFTYSLYDPTIVSRFIMDVSGQIKQLTWLDRGQDWNLFWSQPREQCEVHAYCGAFGMCNQISQPFCNCLTGFDPKWQNYWNLSDYSGGCVRKTRLNCGNNGTTNGSVNGERDMFRESSITEFPLHPLILAGGNVLECESVCLNNCDCTAYAYNTSGCSIWIGDLLNLKQLSGDGSTGGTLYVRLAASEFHDVPRGGENKGIVVGSAVGSVALLVILFFSVVVLIWRRKRKMIGKGKSVEGSLVAFGYRDLQNATKNFSEKLGGGGFGSVYKGTLSNSSVVAVKKLESINQGEKQFRTEVSTIGTIQHVNLVRLRGFCSEGNKKLLVYDYMPNRSLDSHLFNENDSKVLGWKIRYQIALGIARGLAYLHEKCRDCIIHCDIKPENILLDSEFYPKVADFGLAKLVGRDFSRVLTTMRGTRGYLAPEWISGVAITPKADVYSYGMMLFEFLSGRRNSEPSEDGKIRFYPNWASSVVKEGGDVLSLLDHRLEREADAEEVTRICKIACWCIQDDENHRPLMGQVVQILEGVLEVNPPPIPRSHLVFADNYEEHIVFFTEPSSNQTPKTQSNYSKSSSSSSLSKSTGSSSS